MRSYEIEIHEDGLAVVRYGRHPLLHDDENTHLRREIGDLLRSGSRRFLFDWRSIRYLPSDGIGVMLSLAREIRREGGEVNLLLTQLPRLERVVAVTNLAEAVPITWAAEPA